MVIPRGRIVVGERFVYPHMVTVGALPSRAEATGLTLDLKRGGPLWHFTRLRRPLL